MNVLKEFTDNLKNPEVTQCLEDLINNFDGVFCTAINSDTIVRAVIIIKDTANLGHSKIFYGAIDSGIHSKLTKWLKNGFIDGDQEEVSELYKNTFNTVTNRLTKTSIVEILFKLIINNQVSPPKNIYEIMNDKKSQRIEESEYYKLLKDSKEDSSYHLMYGAFDFDFEYKGPILEYI